VTIDYQMYRLLSIIVYPLLVAICIEVFVVQLIRYRVVHARNSLIHCWLVFFMALAFFNRYVAIDAGIAYRASLEFFEALCWFMVCVFALWVSILAWLGTYRESHEHKKNGGER